MDAISKLVLGALLLALWLWVGVKVQEYSSARWGDDRGRASFIFAYAPIVIGLVILAIIAAFA